MKRGLLVALGMATLITVPSTLAQEPLERVYVPFHFQDFQDGGFWGPSLERLQGPDAAEIVTAACAERGYDCTETAAAMAAVAVSITETASVGLDVRGFLSSPPGYIICRAFLGAERARLRAPFVAQLVREPTRNGFTYSATIPSGTRVFDPFVDITGILEFVPETADLSDSVCWGDFSIAWSCDNFGCSQFAERHVIAVTDFAVADGVTTEGEMATEWGVPVIETGIEGGTIRYEFEPKAPGIYWLELDYAATEDRFLDFILNGSPLATIGLRANQDDLAPRRLLAVNAFRWARVERVLLVPGVNTLELTAETAFPNILQIRFEP